MICKENSSFNVFETTLFRSNSHTLTTYSPRHIHSLTHAADLCRRDSHHCHRLHELVSKRALARTSGHSDADRGSHDRAIEHEDVHVHGDRGRLQLALRRCSLTADHRCAAHEL